MHLEDDAQITPNGTVEPLSPNLIATSRQKLQSEYLSPDDVILPLYLLNLICAVHRFVVVARDDPPRCIMPVMKSSVDVLVDVISAQCGPPITAQSKAHNTSFSSVF